MPDVLQRLVSIGSRKATDPIDRYLERRQLFRKHMIVDASSLFRVVAEQVYDTQMLHYEVRMECVRYMFAKWKTYRRFVSGDFDEYLWQLGKTKTAGTVLELGALCHLYRRNVIIYEPFDMGRMITYSMDYKETLRIFMNGLGHFESVLTMQDVDVGAVSQSVSFKMLYKHVFRLPDVNLAVEWMLYPNTFKMGISYEFDSHGRAIRLLCRNGRSFELDRPENTICLLENSQKCPFHSRGQFDNLSCMRILLEHGKKPFPYSVAKSMHPYMYRNVELTSAIEARREAYQFGIYMGDYNFKVGAKCQVELDTNRRDRLSVCYIQSIDKKKSVCQVFVEEQGKLFDVPYDNLHPLPPDEFKVWDFAQKRLSMSRMERQFSQMGITSRPHSCQSDPRQNFRSGRQSSETRLENVQSVPVGDDHLQQGFVPDPMPGMAPPMPPPPLAVPRPVDVRAQPPFFGPSAWMEPTQPLMPNYLMIRQTTFVQQTQVGPPSIMMQFLTVEHNTFEFGYGPHPPAPQFNLF
ncbi:protein ovarian tumor locus [Drosophila simulans]|uniref:GD22696 n=1 Tax=Drosophila simulans TaxID=7240 RepID=B4Q318_DROSI|nr:protein ovarian tumor locus [Drosophila simulans]EDX03734.1 GD22696 [Drosophila simulans]KMY88109.1 uncharacterized protein Dsimw501_GD22696 [Drosophila simulans]